MNPLECKACFEEYHATTRRPRALPCGHSYCEPCLGILKTNQKIRCPTCRREHSVTDVKDLMIVFDLIELLDSKHTHVKLSLNKGECDEHGCPLNFFCATHQEWICRDCTVIEHPKEKCSIKTKKQFLQGRVTEKRERLVFEKERNEKCHSHLKKKRAEIKKEIVTRKELITKLNSLVEIYVQGNVSLEIETQSIEKAIQEIEQKNNELNSILPTISGKTDISNLEVSLEKAEAIMTNVNHWRENLLKKYPEKIKKSSDESMLPVTELINLSLEYTQQTTVQVSVICDGCNISNFHGARYSCLVCNDYDICSACEMTGIHSQHAKLRIPKTATWILIDPFDGIIDSSGITEQTNGPENVLPQIDTGNCWNPLGLQLYHNDWYIVFDLKSMHTIIEVHIINFGNKKHDVMEFKLESSKDNKEWITVRDKFVAKTGTDRNQFFGSFYATGRYWKFTVLKTPNGCQPWLTELNLQGYQSS